jgi:hypothetical protein
MATTFTVAYLRAGYEAKLHKSDGNFSHITIAADDDYFLEITPIIAKGGSPKPLMSHQAFTGELRNSLKNSLAPRDVSLRSKLHAKAQHLRCRAR